MATNKIYSFAQQSLNILSDEEYEADQQRLIGHQPGIARSKLQNKASKQSNIMAAALAQFSVDHAKQDIHDGMSVHDIAKVIENAARLFSISNYPFNQAFCDSVSGYPKGAILLGKDGITLWKSTVDGNITDPDSIEANAWEKMIDIATSLNITQGIHGKLVDAAGLKEHEEKNKIIIYPGGGNASNPAKIAVRTRYVLPNPFPSEFVYCLAEIQVNGKWGAAGWGVWNNNSFGAMAYPYDNNGSIVLQTGILLTGESVGSLNPHGITSTGTFPEQTAAYCRIHVWR